MNNEVVIQSAIAEANMIKKLDHPALPRIVDIIENGDMIFVIMDYIEGETLGSVLREQGAQSQELVIEWALQLCEVLDYLHTRVPAIIYRDMKPDNIMLKPDGNVKLIDFGIAREYKEHKSSDTIGLGTRGYAAPEQFGGQAQTDARTDIYCLGMTMHHLLTGKNPSEPPYETYPIRHWNPQLSTGLEAIVQKCINLNPDKRYQSCAELAYALYHYDEMNAEHIARQKRKLHLFIFSVTAMFLCLLIGFTGMAMKNQQQNSNYGHYLEEAEKAQTVDEKMSIYAQAIDVKPEDTEAYLKMIATCKENTDFSAEKEVLFRDKLETNLDTLKGTENYAELAFEIGTLYWYYYSYGRTGEDEESKIGRINAVPWFSDVLEYGSKEDSFYNMATVYRDIGEFDKNYSINAIEGKEEGRFKKYWEDIGKLVTMIQNSDESEIVVFEVYRLVGNVLHSYAKNLKKDGISREEMEKMHALVKQAAGMSTTTERAESIRKEIEGLINNNGTDFIGRKIAEVFAE